MTPAWQAELLRARRVVRQLRCTYGTSHAAGTWSWWRLADLLSSVHPMRSVHAADLVYYSRRDTLPFPPHGPDVESACDQGPRPSNAQCSEESEPGAHPLKGLTLTVTNKGSSPVRITGVSIGGHELLKTQSPDARQPVVMGAETEGGRGGGDVKANPLRLLRLFLDVHQSAMSRVERERDQARDLAAALAVLLLVAFFGYLGLWWPL